MVLELSELGSCPKWCVCVCVCVCGGGGGVFEMGGADLMINRLAENSVFTLNNH